MRKMIIVLSALSLIGGSAPAIGAALCRDAKGKFVKCTAKPKVCRDAKGKFIKCKK